MPSPSTRKHGRLRRWLGRALYVAFLLLFVELTLQAFYRVTVGSFVFQRSERPMFQADPDLGWNLKSNLSFRHHTPEFVTDVYTNSEGFRVSAAHEEYARGSDASRWRVLLLGPSFAFGWGVNYEDTFAAQLEGMLTASGWAGGRTVEVINRGVPSLPPPNLLNWFEREGREYAPDLVIQFAYGSMAVRDEFDSRQVYDGWLVTQPPSLLLRVVATTKNSALVYYGWTLWSRLSAKLAPPAGPVRIEGAGRELTEASSFDPSSPEVVESLAFYEKLQAAVERAGSRLLVVYFPLAYVIHPEDMGRWKHLGVQNVQAQVDFDAALAELLNSRGIPCLNATPALAEYAREHPDERLYYWLDVHWTPGGNHVVAEVTANYLLARPQWAESAPPSDDAL